MPIAPTPTPMEDIRTIERVLNIMRGAAIIADTEGRLLGRLKEADEALELLRLELQRLGEGSNG